MFTGQIKLKTGKQELATENATQINGTSFTETNCMELGTTQAASSMSWEASIEPEKS